MRPTLRLLPLPLCIAFSLTARAVDDKPPDYGLCPLTDAVPAFADAPPPPITATPEPRVDQATEIEGDRFDGTESETTVAQGNVDLRRGDQFLGTDKLTYDSATDRYTAEGNVRYQDRGMRLLAARAAGDQNADAHTLEDIRYQLIARRGNGEADRVSLEDGHGKLFASTYSTCDPEGRLWELQARQIDVDTEAGFAVARGATLRVGRIPLLYVPLFKFPIDDRRHTGLLFPNISLSGRNGFDYRQPIYLNLAPNYDATLSPRIMTQRGVLLGGEFRYLTETGKGTFEGAWIHRDRLDRIEAGQRDSNRGFFGFDGSQNLGQRWQAVADINLISDQRYISDFSSSLNSGAAFSVYSSMGLNGRGRYWDAQFTVDHWQLSDGTPTPVNPGDPIPLTDANLPFDRLPRAAVRWEQPFGRYFAAGLEAEAVRFSHATFDGGSRVDFKPFVSMPLEGASWFLKPTLAWRYTGYQLDDGLAASLPGGDNSPSRSLPIASLDAGLFFDRDTTWGKRSYLNTLEPRLFYLYSPFREQSGLPLFDTTPLTFSYGQLFRDNRYSGADRQTDANQLTVAVTSRWIRQDTGREKFAASFGQIRYFNDSLVVVPGETPVDQDSSAWIADVNYAPNDRWSLGTSYQWDPKFRREDLVSARMRYLPGDDGVVNFGYRYRRGLLKQVDLSFLYPISRSWSVVGRYYYSLFDNAVFDKQLLEAVAGVQWDSCCLAARLVTRRYVRNRTGELDNALQFEIELKGLGSAGADTERVLRRAILGYYRDDLYLVPPQDRGGPNTNETSPPP